MSDETAIEWTDATWNVITGCSMVSAGCHNCYAMKLAGGRLKHHPSRKGLTKKTKQGPVWTGDVRFNDDWLDQPQRWGRPRRVFVCAHGDLFHENVESTWLYDIFAVMALSRRHIFQVLTKRPSSMKCWIEGVSQERLLRRMLALAKDGDEVFDPSDRWPLPNVWLGTTVENQSAADERIPHLLKCPAAVRFLSCEPLLSRVDLTRVEPASANGGAFINCLSGEGIVPGKVIPYLGVDWVIAGGESGPGARPMHPDWARSLRDQCADAGVPFFFKQWGEWREETPEDAHIRLAARDVIEARPRWPKTATKIIRVGKKAAGRLLDGVEHSEMPNVERPTA
jgi:protein gp37